MPASPLHQPRSILVGVDSSLASRAAVRWAVDNARSGDTVTLVHVWRRSHFSVDVAVPSADEEAAADRFAHRELQHAKALLHDNLITLSCRTTEGDPEESLLSEDADLLVVGAGRHGRLASALIGSVSARIGRHCRIPVVIVPSPGASPP